MRKSFLIFSGVFALSIPSHAFSCEIADTACALNMIAVEAAKIENVSWRDQTYRELAKSLAADGQTEKAIALIEKIETPDTKAMTIRGIGMEAADLMLPPEAYNALFASLRAEAEKITHPPSYAIALTYIAMSQAFAKDNAGAWKTASEMENDALRHKAYGETAEIQAEFGDYAAAMKSIELIESVAFRNKAYSIVSKILVDKGFLQEGLNASEKITNAYKKAQSVQHVLNARDNDNK